MIAIAQRTLFCLMLSGTAAAQVSSEDLKSGPNQNWLTYIGDYSAQRYSPLTTIDRSNVSRLAPKWVRHIDGAAELGSWQRQHARRSAKAHGRRADDAPSG